MFYSQSLLSRKGPFGTIWIAAYCFKELRRDQIAGTYISSYIDKIHSEAHMSYRVLAQLLLGIVRIFSRKVEYLYIDCEEVLTHISHWTLQKESISKHRHGAVKVKEVIRPSRRNATASKKAIPADPMEAMLAPHHQVTITAPNRFELDTFELEDIDEENNTAKHHKQSMSEDELAEENHQDSFLKECYQRETGAHTEFNYDCFTPVNDVIQSDIIDFELGISEFCNSSISEGRRQEPQGDFWKLVEFDNYERLGARISLDSVLRNEEPKQQAILSDVPERVPPDINKEIHSEESKKLKRPTKLHMRELLDHEICPGLKEGHSGPIAQATPSDKSNFPSDAGPSSLKFAIATPAKREQLKFSRKRKDSFDEAVVLSNEYLRLVIHDASSLVCKRRKLPLTTLDAWKSYRITNLQHTFMDPLIPFLSPDFKALLQKRFSNHISLKETSESSNLEVNIQDVHSKILKTPLRGSHPEVSATSKIDQEKVREPSVMETSDTESYLIDLEFASLEKSTHDHDQDDRWPLRTSAVAQYLHKWFLNPKQREEKGMLSFGRILKGKTRTKCAIYFYEILVLKDRGCIDVKQDSPYQDIVISPTPQLEAVCSMLP